MLKPPASSITRGSARGLYWGVEAMKVWDTDSLPARDRLPYWREVLCEAFTSLDTAPHENPHYRSVVELHEFADVNGVELSSFSQTVNHGIKEIRRKNDAYFFINYQIVGECHVEQDGRQLRARPGQFYIVDTTRPYRLDFVETFNTLSFRFPISQLKPLLGESRRVTARCADVSEPLGNLAGTYMRELLKSAHAMPKDARLPVVDTLARLVSLAIARRGPDDEQSCARTRRVLNDSILSYVRERSLDPDLSLAAIAARFRLSPRTLQNVFAECGTSFTQFVLECRLQAASRALMGEAAGVTQVAFDCGFGDVSYFGRAFRRRFGCSPTEWRHEMPQRQGLSQ